MGSVLTSHSQSSLWCYYNICPSHGLSMCDHSYVVHISTQDHVSPLLDSVHNNMDAGCAHNIDKYGIGNPFMCFCFSIIVKSEDSKVIIMRIPSMLLLKIMIYRFRYPNIILVYFTFTRIFLSILHLVGYTDEKALYCTS